MHNRPDIPHILIALILTLPMLAVAGAALGITGGGMGGFDDLRHLATTRLFAYITNTLILMAGVGALALLFGVGTAWLTARYDFPGRTPLEWLLVLPAAVPPYLVAYTYTDFLEYAGPVQTALRGIFGWQDAGDYAFFAIRSHGGAIPVLAASLYPYVYITTRTAFRTTSTRLLEAAIVAGRRRLLPVALPLARGGIAAGLVLVLMETVSDFGTVEYFAVDTITLGVFNVWLGMDNIALAAQLALAAAILVLVLLWWEGHIRARRNRVNMVSGATGIPRIKARGAARLVLPMLCLIPAGLGFILPVGILAGFIIDAPQTVAIVMPKGAILAALGNTAFLAALAAAVIMLAAGYLGIMEKHGGHRGYGGRVMRFAAMLSATGYAFPGVILALGILAMTGLADGAVRRIAPDTEWLITGSLAALVLGYVVRFHAIGYGTVRAGLERIPPNLVAASRVMGHGRGAAVRRIVLPLLRPSLLAGGLLAFVEVMKELPLSLLLSPFNFETLALVTYRFAHEEMLEAAALPALMIIAVGIIPVVAVNRALAQQYT